MLEKGQELVDGPPVVFSVCAEISESGLGSGVAHVLMLVLLPEPIFSLLLPVLSAVWSFLPQC